MKRLLITIFFCLSAVAPALAFDKSNDFDPADPSIWQEQPPELTAEQSQKRCEFFQSSVCPEAGSNLSDIEREKRRREDKRRYQEIDKIRNR